MDEDLAILEEGRSPWPLQTVDDVKAPGKGALISGPFGSNISAKYFTEKGVPVIRGNNLALDVGVRFKDDGFVFITADKADELGTWAQRGDLLFTAVGTIGQVGYLSGNESFPRYIISNKQIRLRIDTDKLLPLFAYYWFASPQVVDLIQQRNTGSSVPLINLTVVKSLPVPVPSIEVQESILAVLGSLDAKIDLLHRQNKTLEAMAETLFRQWFVEEAEEGWEESNIYSLVNVIYGFPFKSKHFNEDRRGLPLIRIRDLKDGFSNIFTDEACDDKYVLQCGDLVAGMDGEFRLYIWSGSKAVLNQRACKFTPAHKYVPYMYVLNLMRPHLHYYENTKVGTTVIHLGKSDIDEIRVALPPKDLLLKYGATTNPMHKKIINNHTQLQSLTALRDTLLPKLMSGEVRVEQHNIVA